MKKKGKVMLLILITIFSVSGCTSTCKVSGCDNEIYKEGLCKTHYLAQQGVNALENLLNGGN